MISLIDFPHSCPWRCSCFFFYISYLKRKKMFQPVREPQCFDNIWFNPPVQGFHKVSRSTSLPFLADVYTRKTDFSKPGTSTRGQVCYLHYTMTCWQAGSVSKCHISTFTWSLAVPTDIHQNLVQSTLWCVCRWHFYWANSSFGIWSKMVKRKRRLLYSYICHSQEECEFIFAVFRDSACVKSVVLFSPLWRFSFYIYIMSAIINSEKYIVEARDL